MDLISIKRKYKNIRNTIIAIFLITIIIILLIIFKEKNMGKMYEKIHISYENQIEQARINEQIKIEQKDILEK